MGRQVPCLEKNQELDLTLEYLDQLSSQYDVMIRESRVVDPQSKAVTKKKIIYLDDLRGGFKQR